MKNIISKLNALITITAIFIMSTGETFAFKVDTHVWVGQQVINDLEDDRRLTISIGGNDYLIAPDDQVIDAILTNKNVYRMGNIGPDALPDMFTGQVVVHPGLEGGWKTDDWLKWLLKNADTPEKKAFGYGYLSHAAADTFAHSYVNFYSGGAYDLLDGELDIETRHFYLETFIAKHQPPLKDVNGVDLGIAANVISTPVEYIKDKLIFNDTVAEQYDKSALTHLSSMYRLKLKLEDFIENKLPEIEAELINAAITHYLAGGNSTVARGIGAASFINAKLELSNARLLEGDDIKKMRKIAEKYQVFAAVNNIHEQIDRLQQYNNEFNEFVNNGIINTADIVGDVNRVTSALSNKASELIGAIQKINELRNSLSNTVQSYLVPIYDEVCDQWISLLFGGYCALTKKVLTGYNVVNNKLWDVINKQLEDALKLKDKLTQEVTALQQDLANRVHTAAELVVTVKMANLSAINTVIDLIQYYNVDTGALREHVQGWLQGVHDAMNAWIVTNTEAMRAMMGAGGDPVKIYFDWFECWLPVIASTPKPLALGLCAQHNYATEAFELLNKLTSGLSDYIPIIYLKNKIVDYLKDELKEEAFLYLKSKTGVDLEKVISIYKTDATEPLLTNRFSSDDGGTGLLLISDVVERVKSEMHLVNGYFDPEKYPVIKNAITLSKLSLLNGQQLNTLLSQAGVTDSIYNTTGMFSSNGEPIYKVDPTSPSNILFDFVRSIDGNHQWRHEAPHYPRLNESTMLADERNTKEKRQFGYMFDGSKGLRIWQDPGARNTVFNKIFVGPVTPALESPEIFGLSKIFPDFYVYGGCAANPYPISNYDRRCIKAQNGSFGLIDEDELDDQWELANLGNLLLAHDDDPDEDGLSNIEEYQKGTNPLNPDSDNDGIPDGMDGSGGINALNSDANNNSIIDGQEDFDLDGLINSLEFTIGTRIDSSDTDSDGLSDLYEYQNGTNPLAIDTDGDGIPDGYEVSNGFNPLKSDKYIDSDSDGLYNSDEYVIHKTDPNNSDTDGDGLPDGYEVFTNLNPLKIDSDNNGTNDGDEDADNDGLSNSSEIFYKSDLSNPDTDGDGLLDGEEVALGTNPILFDTDYDGMSDQFEILNGLNPLSGQDGDFSNELRTIVYMPSSALQSLINQQFGRNNYNFLTRYDLSLLTTLDLTNSGITDLTGLEYAVNLQSLTLEQGVEYVSSHKGYTKIKQLTGVDTRVPVTAFDFPDVNLQICAENEAKKNANTIYADQITYLNCNYDGIFDIGGLDALIGLTKLYLTGNEITDLNPLAGLNNLIWLYLQGNNIIDVSALGSLTNLKNLYLYNNEIVDITPLGSLSNLNTLHMYNNKVANIDALSGLISLNYLHLERNNINNIDALADLVNLGWLSLAYNNISNINALTNLTKIGNLYLNSNRIYDISSLANATYLYRLEAENNFISDISVLSNKTKLRYLDLSANQISDISPLENLDRLWELDLARNKIRDVVPLRNLKEPNFVYLTFNKIDFSTDITVLAQIPIPFNGYIDLSANPNMSCWDLQTLRNKKFDRVYPSNVTPGVTCSNGVPITETAVLDANLQACINNTVTTDLTYAHELTALNCSSYGVANISGLQDFTGLIELDFTNNSLSDISQLDSLNRLTSLRLSRNNITDISALKNMRKLTSLYLDINNISDINSLKNMTALTQLSLMSNNLTDISVLENLTQLSTLTLGHNYISDISPLSLLTELTLLYLTGNNIENISPLESLTKLTDLYLSNNKISDINILSGLTNLSTLDLSYNYISNLYPISNLINLTYLSLSSNTITDTNALTGLSALTHLLLDNNYIGDISPLGNLSNINFLFLSNNNITDISALTNMTNLQYLYLDSNNIRNVAVLANMSQLQVISLRDNNIQGMGVSDLSSLSGLTNIIWLDLSNNIGISCTEMNILYAAGLPIYPSSPSPGSNCSNPVPIANLNFTDFNLNYCVQSSAATAGIYYAHQFQSLDCRNRNISNISGIESLTGLMTLNLDRNNISDISPLANIRGLSSLSLNLNKIFDISTLSELKMLTHLYMSFNDISDLSPLASLKYLGYLNLSTNNIFDLSPLSELINMTSLILNGNNINDISSLSNLVNLTDLFLSQNTISDISSLQGLTNLQSLNISMNTITDISALWNMTKLKYLYSFDNNIADISSLNNLINLAYLYLGSNNINDISTLTNKVNLVGLGLDNNNISNIDSLAGLTNLMYLYLNHNNILDAAPLSNLVNLQYLALYNNEIQGMGLGNISLLGAFTNIYQLNLSNNTSMSCIELQAIINVYDTGIVKPDQAINGVTCTGP